MCIYLDRFYLQRWMYSSRIKVFRFPMIAVLMDTSISALTENYNLAYMLANPAIEVVCYETIEGGPMKIR